MYDLVSLTSNISGVPTYRRAPADLRRQHFADWEAGRGVDVGQCADPGVGEKRVREGAVGQRLPGREGRGGGTEWCQDDQALGAARSVRSHTFQNDIFDSSSIAEATSMQCDSQTHARVHSHNPNSSVRGGERIELSIYGRVRLETSPASSHRARVRGRAQRADAGGVGCQQVAIVGRRSQCRRRLD
jgi:hypothetical protein